MLTAKLSKSLFVLCALTMLASCVPLPELPPPTPFRSLLEVPTQHRVYLPFAQRSPLFGRGGALTHSAIAGCADAERIGATWAYNWTPNGPGCYGIASLPMVWSRDPNTCPELGPGNPVLLWNEPSNVGAWGNLFTPEEAVKLTRLMADCFPGREFATPAEFAGQGGADATRWLSAWWDGYVAKYGTYPPVSYMATHCYAGDAQTCITSLTRDIAWARERNLPVLLTEWGIVPKWAGGEAQALCQADILLHWIQQQPEIIGEAFFSTRIQGDEAWWFGGPTTSMFDPANDTLSVWGEWYVAH